MRAMTIHACPDRLREFPERQPVAREVTRRIEKLHIAHALQHERIGYNRANLNEVAVVAKKAVLPEPCAQEVGDVEVLESIRQVPKIRHGRISTILPNQLPK